MPAPCSTKGRPASRTPPTAPARSSSTSGTRARRSPSCATTTTGASRRAIAEITFQYFTDPNAAANALLDGDIDLHVRIDTDLVEQFEDNPDYVITDGPTNGEFTLGMNNADEALSDQRVRQAITQAIDKQGLIDLYRGYGTLIGAPVPPFEPWYEDLSGLYPYDPDAARALLEEAGYADGLELTFVAPNIYPTYALDYVVSQLADVGITVNLRPSSSRPGSTRCSSTTTTTSPSCSTSSLATSTTTPTPSTTGCTTARRCRNCSPQAKTSPDPDEVVELRRQAAALIAEEAPAVWLLLYNDVIVARAGVSGYPTFDANARFDAFDITVES